MSEFSTLNGYKVKDKKASRFYDNVASMISDATLKDGMHVKTKGYYTSNDGGSAYYHITTEQSLVDHQEDLNNGLYATLIIDNFINVKQVGAKGDGESDDLDFLQKALDISNNIYFPKGNYMIDVNGGTLAQSEDGGLIVGDNKNIVLDNEAYIKAITNNYTYYRVVNIKNATNVKISGGHIYGDKLTHTGSASSEYGHALTISDSHDVVIENCDIAYGFGDSVCISAVNYGIETYSSNVTLRNCKIHDSRRQGVSIIAGQNIKILECEIYNISGIAPQSGIDIESNYADDNPVKNVMIDKCYIHDTTSYSIIVTAKSENVKITNSTIYSIMNTSGVYCLIDNCFINNSVASLTQKTFIINNSIILNTVQTDSGGHVTINNCETYGRFTTTANNNDFIEVKNSTMNFKDREETSFLIIRALATLKINNCILNFDKSLCAIMAEKIEVENSVLNPLVNNIDGFYAKNFLFKNNVINNYALGRIVKLDDGSEPSYISNNIFRVKPNKAFGGTSSQYLFLSNNISPSVLTNDSFDHLIIQNNYTNATV